MGSTLHRLREGLIKRGVIISILVFLASGLSAEETVRLPISWSPAKGAQGYIIQIKLKKDDTLLPDIQVKNPEYLLELAPGDYYFRVGKLNKFMKLSRWSPWEYVRVRKKPVIPVPRKFTPAAVTEGTDTHVTIEGKNFQENTRVTFESGQHSIPAKVKLLSKTSLEAHLNLQGASPGQYDAVIRNPFLPPARRKNALLVRQAKKLAAAARPVLPADIIRRNAVLPGWGFFHVDRPGLGAVYAAAFAGITLFAYTEHVAALGARKDYKRELYALEGASLAAARQFPSLQPHDIFLPLLASSSGYSRWETQTARYNASLQLLGLLYLAQLAHSYFIAPGAPPPSIGRTAAGTSRKQGLVLRSGYDGRERTYEVGAYFRF